MQNNNNELGIKSAAELLKIQFPPMRWVIPELIGEGLSMLNGAPKIGKSWFALNLAIAAASGGAFLGKLTTVKTNTLYLALEDDERRMQSRLEMLKTPEADNLKITTRRNLGHEVLENYLKDNRDTGLVIIDTLAHFSKIDDMNDYTKTTKEMTELKHIADGLNITIIVIHHAKKTGSGLSGADWMETALGSTGLTGAADSSIYISRSRSMDNADNIATLYATGRDIADVKYNLILDLDNGGWVIADNTTSAKAKRK